MRIQWFSDVAAYATCMAWVEFTLVALLCAHCTGFIGVDVRRSGCHAEGYGERGAVMGAGARLRDVAPSSRVAVASAVVVCCCSFGPETVGS